MKINKKSIFILVIEKLKVRFEFALCLFLFFVFLIFYLAKKELALYD